MPNFIKMLSATPNIRKPKIEQKGSKLDNGSLRGQSGSNHHL